MLKSSVRRNILRALVLGAGGQLGTELVVELRRRGITVVGLSREELDITSREAIAEVFQKHVPGWVLNCAAYNHVDLAEKEPERAMRVNGVAVHSLAVACQWNSSVLMHFSTDHVFDGNKGEPYVEEDAPNPPSAYAVSKLAGELYARAILEKLYVVRVAGVFGPAGRYTRRGNFPELVIRKAEEHSPLKVVEDFFASPTYAPALASRCVDLLQRAPFGTYHIGGGVNVSWYEYALKILAAAGLEADIQPSNHREYKTAARRPRNAELSNSKIEALGLEKMPALEQALSEYLELRKKVKHPRP